LKKTGKIQDPWLYDFEEITRWNMQNGAKN